MSADALDSMYGSGGYLNVQPTQVPSSTINWLPDTYKMASGSELDRYNQYMAQARALYQNNPDRYALPAWSPNDSSGDAPTATYGWWTDWYDNAPADVKADYEAANAWYQQNVLNDRWQTKVGNIMSYIPAAVGTIGTLGAAGVLGPAAGFPGTSIFSGAAGAAGAADAAAGAGFVGEGALSGIPAWDGALANAAGAAGAGFIGEGVSSGIPAWDSALAKAGGGTLFDSIVNKAPSLLKDGLSWAADNKGLLSLLAGGLAAAGASGQQNTQTKKTFAPQPGMSFTRPQQPPLQALQGTFTPQATAGMQNSGLARYGASGGTYTPFEYKPYVWGQ